MKHNRIKKVIGKGGKVMYYRGDGMWFGRCGKDEAEMLLATEECILWETVVK